MDSSVKEKKYIGFQLSKKARQELRLLSSIQDRSMTGVVEHLIKKEAQQYKISE